MKSQGSYTPNLFLKSQIQQCFQSVNSADVLTEPLNSWWAGSWTGNVPSGALPNLFDLLGCYINRIWWLSCTEIWVWTQDIILPCPPWHGKARTTHRVHHQPKLPPNEITRNIPNTIYSSNIVWRKLFAVTAMPDPLDQVVWSLTWCYWTLWDARSHQRRDQWQVG